MTSSRAARPTLLVLPFASLGGGPDPAGAEQAGSDQAVLAGFMVALLIMLATRKGRL